VARERACEVALEHDVEGGHHLGAALDRGTGEQRAQLGEDIGRPLGDEDAIERFLEPGRSVAQRGVADRVRRGDPERVYALPAARDREQRAVAGDDASAVGDDVGAARVAFVGGEPRPVDERDLKLPDGQQREEDDEEPAQPGDRAIGQDSAPASRSRRSV
jgi:hypothetical protein